MKEEITEEKIDKAVDTFVVILKQQMRIRDLEKQLMLYKAQEALKERE